LVNSLRGCVGDKAEFNLSENKLLVATQTFDRKMFVYLIQISWPDIKREPGREIIPSLEVEYIKGFVPTGSIDSSNDSGMITNSSMYDTSSMGLSHLEIIATSDIDKAVRLPPMIVAVYTSSVNSLGTSSQGQPLSSRISRWNVASTERKLHPRFDEIASKSGAAPLPPKADLQRLPDIHIEQIVISFHQVDSGGAIAISTQDGSTAFYNPSTMTQLYLETTINEVTSMMSQPGFTFPIRSTPLQMAFSPTGCTAVTLDVDGKVDLSNMEYHSGLGVNNSSHTGDPAFDATVASISLAFTRACYSASNSDDILLCILRSLRPDQHRQLMSSMYQSLFKDADLLASQPGSDIDKLPRNQMVAKVLSLQAALGYTTPSPSMATKQSPPKRNLSSSFAWMTLNIRYVAVHVYVTLASAKTISSEYAEPDILDVICSNMRWSLDLFKLIVDDLFAIAEDAERLNHRHENGNGGTNTNATVEPVLYPQSTTPLTRLLVTSLWSRFFMLTISRCFRGILGVPKSAHHQSLNEASLLAFGRMAQTIEAAGLPLEAFERLLGGADKLVRAVYQGNGYGDKERADTEREILASGMTEGTVLNGVVGRLCEDVLPVTRGEVDRLALFVGDYGWVMLEAGATRMGAGGDDEENGLHTLLGRKSKDELVDAHRKKPINEPSDREVRRCVRCGCVNVDLAGPPRSWPKFSQGQVMRCVCESGFVVEKLGDV
jgi:mediator of RNA polymerase II transcription subunit 16, fungi type